MHIYINRLDKDYVKVEVEDAFERTEFQVPIDDDQAMAMKGILLRFMNEIGRLHDSFLLFAQRKRKI